LHLKTRAISGAALPRLQPANESQDFKNFRNPMKAHARGHG